MTQPGRDPIPRRAFLARGSQAALGFTLLSVPGCAGRTSRANSAAPANVSVGTLVVHLEGRIPDWMQESEVPGLGISIINDGEIAWQRSFGVRDESSQAPVDGDTMFEAASMSKPAFAYVVMKLCESGVMHLDAPLTRYAAERFLDGDPRLDVITARHVLSHTAGFQNWRSDREPLAIHFTPGERFLYSGEGYNYLQTVVSQLVGQPFEAYMRERLFVPLGMRSSGYVWDDTIGRHMARPHDSNGKPIDNKRSTSAAVMRYGAAGALLTTPSDYARFVIAVIDPKPGDTFRLERDSIAEMLRPHVKIEGGRFPASWALGWQVFHNSNRDFIFHGGDNEGFHCAAVASVAGRSGVVVMTNGENGTKVLNQLIVDPLLQQFLAS